MTRDGAALDVRDLNVYLQSRAGMRQVLRDVDMTVHSSRTYALLGESGSGKTCLVHTVLGLHPGVPGAVGGRVEVFGREVFPDPGAFVRVSGNDASVVEKDVSGWNRAMRRSWEEMLGSKVTLVPQDASTSLSPYHTIGKLLTLAVKRGKPEISAEEALAEGRRWLEKVRMYDVESVLRRYVHELSGGMAQRVAIALAMAPGPKLMIADEPTTGLDATLRIDLIALMHAMVKNEGVTLLLVTHDNGAARLLADDVGVLYDGMVVETGPVETVLDIEVKRKHPYTRFLLESERRLLAGEDIPRVRRELASKEGCPYAAFCEIAVGRCREERPRIRPSALREHRLACWMLEE